MELQVQKIQKDIPAIYKSASEDAEMVKDSGFDPETKAVMLRAVAIRFCDLTESEQAQLITTELEQAYIRNGTDKDQVETKAFTVAEIIQLFSSRKQITHKEVSHIFKHGSLGLFGKNFGINVKSVNDWILAFYEDESRKLTIRKLNELKKQSEQVKELTPAERESVMVKMVKEIYFDRKQNGFDGLEMLSYPVYDILKVKGLINLKEHEKSALIEEAEEMIECAKYRTESNSEKPLGANLIYAITQSDATKVAKVLAVRDYFNELAANNIDLPL